MEKILSDLVSNKVQVLLTEGLKKYITLARLLRQLGTSLIALQLFFIGMQVGLLMMLLPILIPGIDASLRLGVCLAGGVIVFTFGSSLYFWNSERAWTRRLQIRSVLAAVKDFGIN